MFYTARYSFARPGNTTQYAQNELVADSATAASVTPMRFGVERSQGRGRISRVMLFTSTTTVTAANFNLHLFTRSPGVPTNGDNGAYGVASNQYWLGTIAMDISSAGEVSSADKRKSFLLTAPGFGFDTNVDGTSDALRMALYGLIETATAATYTPGSGEVFDVALDIEG